MQLIFVVIKVNKNYDDGIKREAEEAQAREERKESVSPPSPGPSEFEAGTFKAPDKALDSSDIDFKHARGDKIFDPSRRPPRFTRWRSV